MKKWVCSVCGYVYEGEQPPVECPVCHVDGSKFIEQKAEKSWAAEHVVGVGKVFGADVPADVQKEIVDGLRANFEGECSEVGMYLAMARVAHREGYPEIGLYWEKAAHEEAEHAAKFAELLGEVITDSTKKNLEMRVDAENGATAGKFELAKLANITSMRSTTPCTRWHVTRPATARPLRVCSSATSAKRKNRSKINCFHEGEAFVSPSILCVFRLSANRIVLFVVLPLSSFFQKPSFLSF